MVAACLINSRDDLPCFEHSLDFGKLDCVCFFPLHGRREKNQEGMRIFIMLSHADPTVLMCTREKIQKKAFSCKERRFLVCVLRVQRERRGQEGGTEQGEGVARMLRHPGRAGVWTLQRGPRGLLCPRG